MQKRRTRAEIRLDFFFKKVIVFEMLRSSSNHFFPNTFEVNERLEMGQELIFLRSGLIMAFFNAGRIKTRLERVVYYRGDDGAYGSNIGFYQGCRIVVHGTSGRLHLSNNILNLLLQDFKEAI